MINIMFINVSERSKCNRHKGKPVNCVFLNSFTDRITSRLL